MNIAVVPAFAAGVLDGVARALRVAPPRDWPTDLAEQAVQTARSAAQRLQTIRVDVEQALRDGVAPHVVLNGFSQFLTMAEEFSSLADKLRQAEAMWVAQPTQGADPLFAAFWDLVNEYEAARRLIGPVVAKLNALPPSIDAARLEEGMEAIRQGDFRVYSDAEDMARDLAGG